MLLGDCKRAQGPRDR